MNERKNANTQRTRRTPAPDLSPAHPVSRENRPQDKAPRSVSSNTKAIEVHIGELVLHGFSHSDRLPIAEAVERELARLFSEGEFPPSLERAAEVSRISGGA